MATKSGELYVEIGARLEGLERGLARSEQMLQRTTRSMDAHSRRANKSLALIGSGLTLYGVERAMMGMVNSAATLDKTLAQLRAVTGANAAQMDVFRKAALQAGTTTAFSVNQAAEAQVALAKAGMTTAQIIGGGFTSALNLATAGGMDLAQAAETMANGMNLFNLSAKQSSRIADGLATAANSTTADVSDFAMALTQGGTAAKAAGLNFNDTMLILESLAKIGVKNSDAGTSMKAAILALLTPTDKQRALMDQLGLSFVKANGKFKDATQISAMLRERLGGLTQTQRVNTLATIAGTDGVRALLALYNAGPRTLKVWEQQLGQQGVAAKQAQTMQDNLGSSIDRFRNSVEAGGISLANVFAPQIRAAADGISAFIRDLQDGGQAEAFAEGVSDAIGGIGDAVRTAAPALGVVKTLLGELGGGGIATAALAFVAMRTAVLGVTSAVNAMTTATAAGTLAFSPLGAALVALQIGVPILMALDDKFGDNYKSTQDWNRALDDAKQKLKELQGQRIDEASAAASLAIATARQADLQDRLTKLQDAGKGKSKEAVGLERELQAAAADTARARQAYAEAAAKPERGVSEAVAKYKEAQGILDESVPKLERLKAAYQAALQTRGGPPAGMASQISDLEKLIEKAKKDKDAVANIFRNSKIQDFANQLANLRNDKGLQILTDKANRAVFSIGELTNKRVALKFGTDDDTKINDKIVKIDDLAKRAERFTSKKRVTNLLLNSKDAEDAITRLLRLLDRVGTQRTATVNLGVTGPNPLRQAGGGRVRGGIPGKDSVLSLLTPGEVVLNAQQQHLVDNGYSIDDALQATGAAYAKGGKIKGSKTPGKVTASPDKKTDEKWQAAWGSMTTAHQIAMSQNDRAITNASLTGTKSDDVAAYKRRETMLNAWIGKINAFAKAHSPMSQALKAAIESEKSSAFQGIASARESVKGLKPSKDPTELSGGMDEALAQAELGGDTGAIVNALRDQEQYYAAKLAREKSPRVRAQLARALKAVRDRIADLTKPEEADKPEKVDPYALPDNLDAGTALAELTAGTEDDMAALQAEEQFYAGKLAEAQAAGDNVNVARMARALRSVREQMTSLAGGKGGAGGAGGGLQGSVYEGYGSTAANLVGSMGSGGSSSGGGGSSYASASTGSGTIVNVTVNVQGQVLTSDGLAASLVEPIRTQLIAIGQRNGSIFGGYA